ncbi:NAD(P)-dependent oxidoreductase [Halogeometricum luteum]|uniref:Hydroxyacid dehydrogenase n=1 Tax=Halogeometricum luteum TaxID=2950537 RepID=A0ABU2G428_9EURY|nr:NAD(P)-dependent oxidoreductase [Halogeometricum sp. S3BR5-2]MDS0295555.1 hydroxyacid dehydrogenase [Halogeometricum sp. S3BR5-2]
MKAVVTANLSESALSRLRDDLGIDIEYRPIEEREGRLPDDEFRALVEDAELLVVGYEGVSAEVIEAASDLRLVACARGGPDANVDIEAATEREIPVLYAPGRNAVSVADFTWGEILSAMRNIAHAHHLLRTGTYTGEPQEDAASGGEREDVTWGMGRESPYVQLKGPELAGKTVGVVGMGAVGREVAKRAAGFEVDLLGFDPYIDADAMAEYDTEKAELDELLERSDVVTVHVPVTDSTRGLIGAEEFETMKESAYFVNNARGAIIDQEALLEQLQTDGLRGAALDVYDMEPIPEDHPLLELDNVVTTPHLAGAAEEVIDRHSEMLVDDIEAYLDGRDPEYVANEETLA